MPMAVDPLTGCWSSRAGSLRLPRCDHFAHHRCLVRFRARWVVFPCDWSKTCPIWNSGSPSIVRQPQSRSTRSKHREANVRWCLQVSQADSFDAVAQSPATPPSFSRFGTGARRFRCVGWLELSAGFRLTHPAEALRSRAYCPLGLTRLIRSLSGLGHVVRLL